MIALVSAPFDVLLNIQFFRPITKGFIDRSARLLSNSRRPSSKKTTKRSHWLRQYLIAFPNELLGITRGVCSLSHAEKASNTGWLRTKRSWWRSLGFESFRERSISKS